MPADFIQTLGIRPDATYTFQQVAKLLDKEPCTIKVWTNVGIKTKRHGIVALDKFNVGRECRVTGSALIDFLQKIQRDN